MSYHDLQVLHKKKRHDLLLSPIPFWNDSFNDYKWSVPNRKNVSILFMIQLFIEGNREILKGQINLVRASFSFEGGKKFIVLLTLMFNLFILCTLSGFPSQRCIVGRIHGHIKQIMFLNDLLSNAKSSSISIV